MTLIQTTIPITAAKEWAGKWQEENPDHAKAFLIPMEDIISILKEMEVLQEVAGESTFTVNYSQNAGIRAYMAIDDNVPPSVGSNEKLLMVGTEINNQGVHCDIVEGGDYPKEATIQRVGSGVFDFTTPCPNYCDPNSPLFNPS